MRLALLLVCGLSLLFAALLGIQLIQPSAGDGDLADATGVMPASRVRVPATAQQTEVPAPALHGDQWMATILARPLFTRDRRPVGAAASVASNDLGALPRLTGIAISPQQRRAIFAGADGAKPIVVEEGGSIAGFTVQTIAPDGVKVHGPDGERTVVLAFDPTPPVAAAADMGQGQAPPPPQPGGIPQLPYPGPYPQPYGQPAQPGGPPLTLGRPDLGRPGPQLDPTAQPMPRPGQMRPRADLGRSPRARVQAKEHPVQEELADLGGPAPPYTLRSS